MVGADTFVWGMLAGGLLVAGAVVVARNRSER